MNIKVLHLVSGQTIVGKQKADFSEGIYLDDPFELMSFPNQELGRMDVTLIPFGSLMGLLPAVTSLTLTSDQYFAAIDAPPDLINEYLKVCSGIIVGN
jgi:hypothetical protein